MNLQQVTDKLDLNVLCGADLNKKDATGGYVSDLLSDVMGNATDGDIWITMQTHKNIIAVAVLKDLSAILLVNGNKPDEETLFHADKEKIVILSTSDSSFNITGKLYNLLNGNEHL